MAAHALPKIDVGLQAMARELAHGKEYLLGSELSLADYYMLPSTYAFGLTEEAKAMYPKYPNLLPVAGDDGGVADRQAISRWTAPARSDRACAGMGDLASPEVLKRATP